MSATGNSDPSSSYIGQECEPKLERPEPPIHDSQFRPHMPASVGSMLTFSVELLPFLLRFFFYGGPGDGSATKCSSISHGQQQSPSPH